MCTGKHFYVRVHIVSVYSNLIPVLTNVGANNFNILNEWKYSLHILRILLNQIQICIGWKCVKFPYISYLLTYLCCPWSNKPNSQSNLIKLGFQCSIIKSPIPPWKYNQEYHTVCQINQEFRIVSSIKSRVP